MDFKSASEKVKSAKKILIVSHYDCDGLCSAKILMEVLKRQGKKTEKIIAKELNGEIVSKAEKSDADLIIFSDLGSGYLSLMPKSKEIVILDHHEPESCDVPLNVLQVNPCLEGKTLCGAGVCYLFAKELSKNNLELIDFAVVGSIGDGQVMKGENKKIVEEARKMGRLKIEKGLNIFGHVNRPLTTSIKNSNQIPLNTESEIMQFLSEIKIDLGSNGKIKSYCDLEDREKEILKTELFKEVLRRDCPDPTKIFSNIYILTRRPKRVTDAQEFSTILNAFGRLERFDDAFVVLDGNLEKIDGTMLEYRQRIATYLSWVGRNIKNFESDKHTVYIDAGSSIEENLIGTIVSISINGMIGKKIVVGLAEGKDGVKVSARSKAEGVNLDEMLCRFCADCGGYGGGHIEAAGGKIPLGKSKEFIEMFKSDIKSRLG